MNDAALRIGTVTAVRGRNIEISVDSEMNETNLIYHGEVVNNVSISSFLTIPRGYRQLVVQIGEEELIEDRNWNKEKYQRETDRTKRYLKALLIGEYTDDVFTSGVSYTPMIGNVAYLATKEQVTGIYSSHNNDINAVHSVENSSLNHGDSFTETNWIRIGALKSDESIDYTLNIAKFFASHIGIFGNTGSGKSYTLTQLYSRLIDAVSPKIQNETSTHFLLFDLNGEYSFNPSDNVICNGSLKDVHDISNTSSKLFSSSSPIPLPEETLKDPDFWFTVLEATEKTQRPFIQRTLSSTLSQDDIADVVFTLLSRLLEAANPTEIDRSLVFSFLEDMHRFTDPTHSGFINAMDTFRSYLQFNSKYSYYYFSRTCFGGSGRTYSDDENFEQRVEVFFDKAFSDAISYPEDPLLHSCLLFHLQFYSEVAKGFSSTPHLRPLILRLSSRLPMLGNAFQFDRKIFDGRRLFTIINLEHASIEEKKLIPLIITRAFYKEHKKLVSIGELSYLNIIIDEAHNLLSRESSLESDTWRNSRLETFREVLKEGRKFGVFLTLASQRPQDIDATITSQLHHYLLHRLVNPRDLETVRNAVSFLDRTSFDMLPTLPTGSCIISGTSIQLPSIVQVDPLPIDRCPHNDTIDLKAHWAL